MFRRIFLLLALPFAVACTRPATPTAATAAAPTAYFPAPGEGWLRQAPAAAGFDSARLAAAITFAQTQETTQMTPNFSTQEEIFGKLLGPMPTSRAATNGLILRHGYIVAEWGDTQRPDPTYSAAKSFLSTLLGISLDRGLIKNIKDPVAQYIKDGGYDSEQNRQVTWEHHARQTSEWEGELWGKNANFLGREAFGKGERKPRPIQVPGTYYEYNDVRINRLALSLLRLWEKPLPAVLKKEVLDPIGASNTWRWVPYPNAVATVKGKAMPSVSGGTRWGGGWSSMPATRPASGT